MQTGVPPDGVRRSADAAEAASAAVGAAAAAVEAAKVTVGWSREVRAAAQSERVRSRSLRLSRAARTAVR